MATVRVELLPFFVKIYYTFYYEFLNYIKKGTFGKENTSLKRDLLIFIEEYIKQFLKRR